MPLFNKKENELENKFDKWCYFLKNLENFDQIPSILNEPIFQKAFTTAELARLSVEQRDRYEQSLIQYRDLKSVIETAVEEAVEETVIVIAKSAILEGADSKFIAKITGLSET
jgi:predicted transposase/invertase (TIGR01784 family)